MYQFPIGAIVESFKQETYEAVKTAASIGVQGLQLYCTKGWLVKHRQRLRWKK